MGVDECLRCHTCDHLGPATPTAVLTILLCTWDVECATTANILILSCLLPVMIQPAALHDACSTHSLVQGGHQHGRLNGWMSLAILESLLAHAFWGSLTQR